MDYCGGVGEKGREDRGVTEREVASQNCFEMCLMEGSLSVAHDVIYAIPTGKQRASPGVWRWKI